jgi:hypothetical protein
MQQPSQYPPEQYAGKTSAPDRGKEPTLNERIWTQVRFLNETCERCEAVLNRIAPRPPTPVATSSERSTLNRDNNAPPLMLEVVAQLEQACHRARTIELELHHIA